MMNNKDSIQFFDEFNRIRYKLKEYKINTPLVFFQPSYEWGELPSLNLTQITFFFRSGNKMEG